MFGNIKRHRSEHYDYCLYSVKQRIREYLVTNEAFKHKTDYQKKKKLFGKKFFLKFLFPLKVC